MPSHEASVESGSYSVYGAARAKPGGRATYGALVTLAGPALEMAVVPA
jgi:hypothetical protein